jgi:protein SCO1/2
MRLLAALFLLQAACWALAAGEPGGRTEALPKALEGVGIQEKLGGSVPLTARFKDTEGKDVTLGDYFNRGRPVVLTLNYSNCPMLCSLQLNGLVNALKQVPLTPGKEFEIVTVGLDPLETPQRAKQTLEKYVEAYERPEVAAGWHFLTGQEQEIKVVADSVGFGYRYDPESKQYMHAAVTMVISPAGITTRYLRGIEYDPKTFRLALIEAGEGRIGTSMDQLLLYCFHYDSAKGKYAPSAMRLMQVGGALTVAVLGVVLLAFWRREARRKSAPEAKA